MAVFNIHEAKTHFSKLVNQALKGEEVVIARGNEPLLKLVLYVENRAPRKGGQLKGLMKISEDFDAPLPPEILEAFGKA